MVYVVGTLVGGFFGRFAGMVYAEFGQARLCDTVGPIVGAGAGLLAGMLWCQGILRTITRSGTVGLVGDGARTGIMVGWMATLILHLVLWIVSGYPDVGFLAGGLVFALFAGLVAGAVCGIICEVTLQQKQGGP